MATVVLHRLGPALVDPGADGAVVCLSTRWPHSLQQQCGFRKAARKPESRKVEEDLGHSHAESSEAPPPRRHPTSPQWEQQAPPSSPRAFSRLLRPLVFTVGVRCRSPDLTSDIISDVPEGANAMSVHRLLFRLGGHLAVRVAQVPSPELLRRGPSRLAGEAATAETRRRPQTGETHARL